MDLHQLIDTQATHRRRQAGRRGAHVALLGTVLTATQDAEAANSCPFPSSYAADLRTSNWSFTPPCSDTVERQSSTIEHVSSWSHAVQRTGDAPNKLPYLRHPAGGDPVLGDGEFFEDRKDAELPGYGLHYEFVRTYRSRASFRGDLGAGWDHSYDQRILGIYNKVDLVDQGTTIYEVDSFCDKPVGFQDGALNRIHFTYQESDVVNCVPSGEQFMDCASPCEPPNPGDPNSVEYQHGTLQWSASAPGGGGGDVFSVQHIGGNGD